MRWACFEDVLKTKNVFYRRDVSCKTLSTFRIGGTCRLLVEPQCHSDLMFVTHLCTHLELPFAMIGCGSNLLFDDGYLEMVLIRTLRLNALRFEGEEVVADAGVPMPLLARRAATLGYGDFAFLSGIPGTVGAGAVMNAGAFGGCLADIVKSVEIYSFAENIKRTLINKELNYSYRKSILQGEKWVVLRVRLALTDYCGSEVAHARIAALSERRNATQPHDLPNAGSTFLRPSPDVPLSRILDELGLKGLRCGNAAVSHKHAGFIVNLGGASAEDVKNLIYRIQNIVEKERGFRPRSEIRLISDKT